MRSLVAALVLTPLFVHAQASWTVERTAAITVPATSSSGDAQFASATWATRLSSGEIAIADAMDGVIRIADKTGRTVRSLGRRGSGPGEFGMLNWVGQCGASLYAWDAQQARASVFDVATGNFRQFGIPEASGTFSAACSPAGKLAVFTMNRQAPPAVGATGRTPEGGEYRVMKMTAGIRVTDSMGVRIADVPNVLWMELIAGRLRAEGGLGVLPRPLGTQTSFGFIGDRLVVGLGDSSRVEVIDAAGKLEGGFTVAGHTIPPTREQYERAIASAITMAPPNMLEMLTAFAKAVPTPERLPAIARVLTTPTGLVWVVTSPEGEPVTRLTAYRASGEVVARLELPLALSVFEVGDGHVLGRTEDAEGEQSVVLYRFTRR